MILLLWLPAERYDAASLMTLKTVNLLVAATFLVCLKIGHGFSVFTQVLGSTHKWVPVIVKFYYSLCLGEIHCTASHVKFLLLFALFGLENRHNYL